MSIWTAVADPRTRRTRSWVFDVWVAAVVAGISVPHVVSDLSVPLAVGIAGLVVIAAPLLVRRVWPIPVLLVELVVAVVLGVWDIGLAGSLALLVGAYTVAALGTRTQAFAAAASVEVLAVVAAARLHGESFLLPLVFYTGMVVAALGLGLYAGTRAAYVAELIDRAARLERERDTTNALAAAAERARIAREMHDIVAHHLTVMVALSDGAERLASTDPDRAREVMSTVSATGRDALRDTRRLLGVLHDDTETTSTERPAPLPGIGQLDALIDSVRAVGLPVDFTVDGTAQPTPADTQLAVYRLVQEALTNTMKHARAGARCAVILSYGPTDLRLRVRDDGAGQSLSGRPLGRGLTGMQARVAAVGGWLQAGPRPGGGWQVDAGIPVVVDSVAGPLRPVPVPS